MTQSQREGWESLGSQIQRTDSLGQTYTLNGFMAFCSVYSNLSAAGESTVSDAPAIVTPGTLATATITLTGVAFSVAYTATPLAANTRLMFYAGPQRSAGRQFESDYRLIQVSAAAAASPLNVLAAYTARLGVPVTGNRIFMRLELHKGGFLGAPLTTSAVVA